MGLKSMMFEACGNFWNSKEFQTSGTFGLNTSITAGCTPQGMYLLLPLQFAQCTSIIYMGAVHKYYLHGGGGICSLIIALLKLKMEVRVQNTYCRRCR